MKGLIEEFGLLGLLVEEGGHFEQGLEGFGAPAGDGCGVCDTKVGLAAMLTFSRHIELRDWYFDVARATSCLPPTQ